MAEIKGLELPDVGESRWFSSGDYVVKLGVEHDPDPENPMEVWDGQGTIHSFNRKHGNFLDLGASSREGARLEIGERFGEENVDWLLLGYFEHGNCSWFPLASGRPPGTEGDFRWDGCSFAGVWVVDDVVRENINIGELEGDARYEWLLAHCKGVCEEYMNWCNGWVYGYSVSVWKDGEVMIDNDSCWGFSGMDHEKSGLRGSVEDVLAVDEVTELKETEEGVCCNDCGRLLPTDWGHSFCKSCAEAALATT